MGIFDFIFGTGDYSSKRETRIEGRASKEHTHKDGSRGQDIYATKVSYVGNEKVSEKDAGFGHISEGSDTPNHVK